MEKLLAIGFMMFFSSFCFAQDAIPAEKIEGMWIIDSIKFFTRIKDNVKNKYYYSAPFDRDVFEDKFRKGQIVLFRNRVLWILDIEFNKFGYKITNKALSLSDGKNYETFIQDKTILLESGLFVNEGSRRYKIYLKKLCTFPLPSD